MKLRIELDLDAPMFYDRDMGTPTADTLRQLADVIESEGDEFATLELNDENGIYFGVARVTEF
jgi:hypothetical protein